MKPFKLVSRKSLSPYGTLSEEQVKKIYAIRDEIMRQARLKVDPNQTGFDAQMQGTGDGDFFGVTEEQQFEDWLDWAENFLNVISRVSQRVSLAVVTGAFAIAGSIMAGSPRTETAGFAALGLAGAFAVWFAVSVVSGIKGQR